MAAPLTKRPANLPITLAVRVPRGLKEWYDRRAREQGVTTSELIRDILQAKRNAVTGRKSG